MKLNIEELISQSNEAAKLALDHHLHEGFDRERMKAFAGLIVERCAQECLSRVSGGLPITRGSSDFDVEAFCCARDIRNLMED